MNRTTRRLRARGAAWFLAVALAFGGFAEAGPAVLCIGDDGHTDVEYSLAGCCVPEAVEAKLMNSVAQVVRGPDCDECVDLGLDQDSLIAGGNPLPAPEATLLGLALSPSESAAANPAAVSQWTAHNSLTTVLSSTVLLV